MMKFGLLSLAALCAVTVSNADDLVQARTMMASAMLELSSHQRIGFYLHGEVWTGGKGTETFTQADLDTRIVNNKFNPKFELWNATKPSGSNDPSTLTDLVLGDGALFWKWDPSRKQYGTVRYGNDETGSPPEATNNMLKIARSQTRGEGVFLVSMLQDAMNPSGLDQRWQPLLTMGTTTIDQNKIIVESGSPVDKRIIYFLTPPDVNQPLWRIQGVAYWQQDDVGGVLRTRSWQISAIYLDDDTHSPAYGFSFAPPAGAIPISLPGRQGG